MKKAVRILTVIILLFSLLPSFSLAHISDRQIRKAKKEKARVERILAAQKNKTQAEKTVLALKRQLKITENRLKYADSTSAIYKRLAKSLKDSLAKAELQADSARIEMAMAYGHKIKKTHLGRTKQLALSNNSYYRPIHFNSSAPSCSGGQCGGRVERQRYMNR